jgi:hypothetical protein
MAKFYWKKKKAIAMYLNRRQWNADEDNPSVSSGEEIITEAGVYIITQSSSDASPNYIITE